MTDNEIMQALEHCYASGRVCGYCPCTSNIDCVQLEKYALDLINRQKAEIERLNRDYSTAVETMSNSIRTANAEKEALIAGQETLQKAYEALKAAEEREHQYCKNVCEPDFKARIANEKAMGDICASAIKRQDKEIASYRAELERFKKIETSVNAFWSELQKITTFKKKSKPTLEELLEYMENLKAETIKEFAERLKGTFPKDDFLRSTKRISEDIDNLVKEMTDPSLLDKKFGGDAE